MCPIRFLAETPIILTNKITIVWDVTPCSLIYIWLHEETSQKTVIFKVEAVQTLKNTHTPILTEVFRGETMS
jgi:hypothetical protein